MKPLVVIKGGGDLATGIAHRLFQCNFRILITELAQPTVVRRTVAFAQAVFDGETVVEGVTSKKVTSLDEALAVIGQGNIPVLIDPEAACIRILKPAAVVDAVIAKRNTGTAKADAPIVVAAGPGFTAGTDVHAVIETMRGHDLGRVFYTGTALADTGVPGEIGGATTARLLRSPADGSLSGCRSIGDIVCEGEAVAMVGSLPVNAAIGGVLRGLVQDGLTVRQGMKVGDIDPRCEVSHCFTISDKARAIGGGVLEALLHLGVR